MSAQRPTGEAFLHLARLVLDADADPSAPGGAVTLALCGAWEHPPPGTWPHHTEAIQRPEDAGCLDLRTIFVADPAEEWVVRQQISEALARGQVSRPDGSLSSWHLQGSGPGSLQDAESARAARLAR